MTRSLPFKPLLQIAAGASACLFALVVSLVIAGRGRVEYPDCPFTKLPAGTVCYIPTAEPPSVSKPEERKAYWDGRRAIFKAMKETGCEKNATPEEAAALQSYYDKKYVRAREQSETILRKHSDSLPGMFVRASALLEGAGNPAAALRQARVMRRALEALGRKNPDDAIAREWYIRCVWLEQDALERLGEDRYALRCIELLEQVFEPLPWEKTWPLFRLKEFEQAAESIAAMEKTGRWPVRTLNSRLALELQINQRAEGYQTAQKLMAVLAPKDDQDVYLGNRGRASWSTFQFQEVEVSLKSAREYEDEYSRHSADVRLADLNLQAGRLTAARDALLAAKSQRDRRNPSTWQFLDSERRAALAALLLVAGRVDVAERLARDCVERPDRLGTTTMGPKDQQLLADLLLYAALHDRIEVLKEGAASGIAQPDAGNRRALEMELWLIGRRVQSNLDGRRAEFAFFPHVDEMPTSWLMPTLLEILPAGVAQGMIDRAQEIDAGTGADAYYIAARAELQWRNGRHRQALELVQAALGKLPAADETVLRTRLTAIAADAAFRLGRYEESRAHFGHVLSTQPGMLRALGIQLPVQIQADGSDAGKEIAQQLARSPRFVTHSQGFPLVIATASGKATCSLQLATGPRKLEVAQAGEAPAKVTLAQQTCQEIHQALFSAQLEIDVATINQITGSQGAVRERDAISNAFARMNQKKS